MPLQSQADARDRPARILAEVEGGGALAATGTTGLDLEAAGVAVLCPALFNTRNITALYLARNSIAELPAQIRLLTGLEILVGATVAGESTSANTPKRG